MENKTHILVVDDDNRIRSLLKEYLNENNFIVSTSEDAENAKTKLSNFKYDLIILDVMMPGMDGIETCEKMRKIPTLTNALIIFLTARNEDFSQIAGLEAGADDYISKPIKPKVFLSRVKAILRRSNIKDEVQIYGDVKINFETKELEYKGSKHSLTKKEYGLLTLLASRPGKVFGRDEILQAVWGGDVVVGNRTIDVHIKKLREKTSSEHIKTVKGFGYKFTF